MERFYRRWSRATMVAIFLIIVAGGVVRMTGSGMGCPDWPKCFDMWVPPTDVSELPADYAETFKAKYGYEDVTFNAFKTWTEYINRLIGFVAGNMTLILLLFSVYLWWRKKIDVWQVVLAVLLVAAIGYVAWLGSRVVYSDLDAASVTEHMLSALVVVALSLAIVFRNRQGKVEAKHHKGLLLLTVLFMVSLVVQITLGTGIREEIDVIAKTNPDRATWVGQLPLGYLIHRSFSWLILLFAIGMVYLNQTKKLGYRFVPFVGMLVVFIIIIGVGMAWYSVPAILQPLHLVLATVLFGVTFYLLLQQFFGTAKY